MSQKNETYFQFDLLTKPMRATQGCAPRPWTLPRIGCPQRLAKPEGLVVGVNGKTVGLAVSYSPWGQHTLSSTPWYPHTRLPSLWMLIYGINIFCCHKLNN